MKTTEHYNLIKPESNEQFDIKVFNENANTIDTALANKANSSDVYTKDEVDSAISAINQMKIKLVETLPTEDIDDHTIYYLPKTKTGTNDIYDEYIYINNSWEMIGHTQVDLSDYIKSSNVLSYLNTSSTLPVNSTAVSNALSGYVSKSFQIISGETTNPSQGTGVATFNFSSYSSNSFIAFITTTGYSNGAVVIYEKNSNCVGVVQNNGNVSTNYNLNNVILNFNINISSAKAMIMILN